MSNDIPKIPNQKEYKDLTPFDLVLIQKFPFIEEDFDAINLYGIISKIKCHLNTVISNEQIVTENQQNVFKGFTDLHNYVEDYFTNLDVQDEINNKLDEMVDDGTLESILQNYVKLQKIYDTTSELFEASDLHAGMKIKTLGYYSINDGGGLEFFITDTESQNEFQYQIGNLYATPIFKNNTINIKQIGGRSNLISDLSKTDNKQFFDLYLSICNKCDKRFKLFIPQGLWFMTPTLLSRYNGIHIEGEECFNRSIGSGTILLPYNDNQTYILKIGGLANYDDTTQQSSNDMTTQSTIKNLIFSTGAPFEGLSQKVITKGLFILDKCQLFTIDNLYFQHFVGIGLRVRDAWEINCGTLNFRNQNGFNYGNILFDDVIPLSNISGNISAFDINYLMFEGFDGYLIKSSSKSGFSHNHIGHINIECGFNNSSKTNISLNDDISSFVPIDLISGFYRTLMIDSINFVYNNNQKATDSLNYTYYFRSLFATLSTESVEQSYDSTFVINVGSLDWHSSSDNNTSVLFSHMSYYRAKLLISGLLWFDDVPKLPFNLYKGAQVIIGTTNNVINKNSVSLYDAFNFVGTGNPNGQLEIDEDAPSSYNIVVNSHDATINNLFFKNIYGSSLAPKVLIKNNTDTVQTIALRDTSASNAQKTISIPANSDWTWYQFESNNNWSINDDMILILKNCSCAKIIF